MFIVQEVSAQMPSKIKAVIKATYRMVRVLEVDQWAAAHNYRPPSCRDKHVLRVVTTFGPVPAAGKTARSGIFQARTEARAMVHRLNNLADMATADQIIGAGGSA